MLLENNINIFKARMKKNSAVINYCTNDYRFLKPCIAGLKPFCSEILIPVCSHFFSGEPENQELLHRSYAEHPDCHFIEFCYDPQKFYGFCAAGVEPRTQEHLHYWHSTARYVGWHFLSPDTDSILFVDVDEICDEKRFAHWVSSEEYTQYEALHFSSYLYFREPQFRAQQHAHSILLLKREAISSPEILLNFHERPGIFFHFSGKKKAHVRDLKDQPMVHHYSWVKPKNEMLRKVRTWGHKYDQDWETLIEEEFSQDFRGYEHLNGFRYRKVKPQHSILETDVESLKAQTLYRNLPKFSFPNVTTVTPQEIFALNLQKLFHLEEL
jgi:hypothetical protein